MTLHERAAQARQASIPLGALSIEAKNTALAAIRDELAARAEAIIEANKRDLEAAEKANVAAPLVKRLKFGRAKLDDVLKGIDSLIGLPDPVGRVLSARELDQGLSLYQVSSPIGVIGIIFESRPDALVQIATLCLKSGNAVLLKGGVEALHTNRALAEAITTATGRALTAAGLSADDATGWAQLLETREDVKAMLALDTMIDLVVPRGSNQFVRFIMENTSIPVLGHADGICHLYVHADADVDMAVRLAVDSKVQYVAVCNALETLLVHRDVAPAFLPAAKKAFADAGVTLRGCEATRAIISCSVATDKDWRTEYLDLLLSVKVVASLDEAIRHVNTYGSHHTDTIVSASRESAERFMALVDSAGVFWNCSTRFSDGFRYGLGAEVGVSTSKIHARGPVGLEGLVTYKWRLYGSGQAVAPYASGDSRFTHRSLDPHLP
jgi:glutamate-5-semialdehyde dehydrogenase